MASVATFRRFRRVACDGWHRSMRSHLSQKIRMVDPAHHSQDRHHDGYRTKLCGVSAGACMFPVAMTLAWALISVGQGPPYFACCIR